MTTIRAPHAYIRRINKNSTRIVADALPKTEIGKLTEAKRLYRMGWSVGGIAKRLEMDVGVLKRSLGIYDEGR